MTVEGVSNISPKVLLSFSQRVGGGEVNDEFPASTRLVIDKKKFLICYFWLLNIENLLYISFVIETPSHNQIMLLGSTDSLHPRRTAANV